LALAAAGLATATLSVFLGQARWQMTPVYVVLAVSSLLLLKRSFSHVALRSLGVALGTLLLATGAAASLGLPILTLPPPDGPHAVGVTSASLVDTTRDNAFFGVPGEARELYVQAWYPGARAALEVAARPRTLWEELYRGALDRFTFFSRYLRGIETHSFEDLPLASAEMHYPVIVFSHALGSFAEQSTLLMEHLASHGYVVLGVGHPYVSMRVPRDPGEPIYVDLDKINELDAQLASAAADLEPKIANAASVEERTQLALERYERASGYNALMAVWVADLRFVLDSLTGQGVTSPPLQPLVDAIDADRIGLLGMSFGGAAVTELCKDDARCRAGMNIDGGSTFGQRQRRPLRVPFLALVQDGSTSLRYLLDASRSDYYEVEVSGATHLDFTDDTVVLPILKALNVTGDIAGERVIEVTNAVALRFFDAYLRGAAPPQFSDFAELTVRTNELAAGATP
jgi:predicted dienelactone hydrolase